MSNSIKNIRNIAVIGPYSSGKTTLLESLLFVTEKISRKGSIAQHNTVGDSSPEARDHGMSVEVSVASTTHANIDLTFLDCPGSIEFLQETYNALVGVGTAIIVCEPETERILTLAPLFKFLDDWDIPHLVFINKMDRAKNNFLEILDALKEASSRPLVPQQYPIRKDRELIGFIDLVSEQAYHYHPDSPADPVPFPAELKIEEQITREEMLETLADFDDQLLEKLLEEVAPSSDEILQDLRQELSADQVVPVMFGIAEQDYGIRPLLDALVKEAPAPTVTTSRRQLKASASETIVQVLKNFYTPQGGKLSLVRVWQGELKDGMLLNGDRPGGIYHLMGGHQQAIQTAVTGEIVALARMDSIKVGDTLSTGEKTVQPLRKADIMQPVYALAITPERRKDEVKLSAALGKLIDEDPSLAWEQHGDTHEVILWGQGDIHLQVALERLNRKYNIPMSTQMPKVPYKETIRKSGHSHGRYKHQTGGHGAFGDVHLDIKPLSRGSGFQFHQSIVGGVVPKQYIPGVEMGVKDSLQQGPLGYPVVDVDVTLTNGSYHSVDSSEQAFKQAARIAMKEGMQNCDPQLLEPILTINLYIPNEFTSNALQLVSGKRGQILGYESSTDWQGWDHITAHYPIAEMHDLIIELRSLTFGVGFFDWQYDHLQAVPEKVSEKILSHNSAD
ncbi:translation elongation factor 2 (EF-2/EF-G) [[Leptolyngbya] sp. PCC 7376]|uniref:elongation factor G n=1 Tax=[Leptolyngbya] sp. PCC 7376 TaxID=111781 RepID=UPI00029F1CFD|nr:elongation factor G [[Leptolyngbya] sp. PCC 7376]AFY36733.1 translation elongation factor 2 (EF-2/EF-G) [[Leptolyngbya] sp. PCC 7376]